MLGLADDEAVGLPVRLILGAFESVSPRVPAIVGASDATISSGDFVGGEGASSSSETNSSGERA